MKTLPLRCLTVLGTVVLFLSPTWAVAQPWRAMDYGPFLTTTLEVDRDNIAYKGVVIRLDSGSGGAAAGEAFIVFDTDTLRYAAGWTGPGLMDWRSVVYDGSHQTHPALVGERVFVNPTGPGWADPDSEAFADRRLRGSDGRAYGPLDRRWGRWKGLYQRDGQSILAYSVGGTDIWDSPSLEESQGQRYLARTIEIGPRDHDLTLQVASLPGGRVEYESVAGSGSPSWSFAMLRRPVVAVGSESNGQPDHRRFDGSEHFLVGDGGDFDLTGADFSVAARLRTTEGGTIFSQAAPSGPWTPNGKTLFIRDGRLCYDIGWVGVIQTSARVDDGQWHDVALTYRAATGEVRLYVDAGLRAEGRLKPTEQVPGQVVRLGYTATNFPEPISAFVGDLQEVRFHQRQLEEAELTQCPEGPDDSLRGQWLFSHVERGRVPDASGRGHVGVATPCPGTASAGRSDLAVACLGLSQPMWLSAPDGSLRLRIHRGATPLRLKLLFSRLDSPEAATDLVTHARGSAPAANLVEHLQDGASLWPERLETRVTTLGDVAGAFTVETLTLPEENPWRSWLRLGGLDFFADGDRAAVCSWQGDVWVVRGLADPAGRLVWQRVASGLFQPLGLRIVADQIYVLGRDQITRLVDFNGDGETDFYENFNNDAQVTDHFHEFAMDLQTDQQGNFYYLKAARHALPAVVPQHGTLIQVSSDGKQSQILAHGFRAPDGLAVTGDGTFLNTDQEGHWTPMNRVNWIRPGGFYGNMMAANPRQVAVDEADLPVCWIHREMDRSPTEPVWVPVGAWSSLEGSLLCLSYGTGKTWRVLYEHVGDVIQGGIALLPMAEFPTGIQRGRFHPRDGMLYVCGLFGWSSDKTLSGGLYRIRYSGAPLPVPDALAVRRPGVLLHFPIPLDPRAAADRRNYVLSRWNYQRTENYGSGDFRVSDGKPGRDPVVVDDVSLSLDRQSVFLHVRDLVPSMQARIQFRLQGADGQPIAGIVDHTVHVPPELTDEMRDGFPDRLAPPRSADGVVDERTNVEPGLLLRIDAAVSNAPASDVRSARLVALKSVAGTPPSVFVPAGSFVARWEGFVQSPLPTTALLQADFAGTLRVTVNGETVLQSESAQPHSVRSESVALGAGLNSLQVVLQSLPDGEAQVRLLWQHDQDVWEPLRPEVLCHDPADSRGLAEREQLRLGRELIGRLRCGQCHALDAHAAMPELQFDLPSLVGVGDRLGSTWLSGWIRDPSAMRSDVTMPQVLSGGGTPDDRLRDATDLVAYLRSLRGSTPALPAEDPSGQDESEMDNQDAVQRGMMLSENLGCIGCHHWGTSDEDDPYERISLCYCADKYPGAALVEFLLHPHTHFVSRRMPDFGLSSDEARALAAFVRSHSTPLDAPEAAGGDPERGKQVFQDRACAACHLVAADATLPAPAEQPLFALRSATRGCLASDESERGRAPHYALSDQQRQALQALLHTDGESLTRYVPVEAAQRFMERLRCNVCHRRDSQTPILPEVLAEEGEQGFPAEFLPPLTWTGEKLQADWLQSMLEGKLTYQTRPWKRGRMAAFPAYAAVLAEGLAAQHAQSAERDPSERGDPDPPLASLGRRLLEPNEGFNCLQCHGLPGKPPEAPFESRGIDFQLVRDRLRHDFYQRWINNPIQFDVAVPMPRFSPDGQTTPIQGLLEGDATRQFDAIWHYLQTLQPK